MTEIRVAWFPILSLSIFCAFLHIVPGNTVKYLYTVQSQFAHSEARFFQTEFFLQHTHNADYSPVSDSHQWYKHYIESEIKLRGFVSYMGKAARKQEYKAVTLLKEWSQALRGGAK